MNRLMAYGLSIFLGLATTAVPLTQGSAQANQTAPTAEELLGKIDQLYRFDSSQAEMRMVIQTPEWTREMKLQAWTRGMERTLIRVLEPRKDRGVATLKNQNEMWNYFPKVNKVIKVPPSMMMGSWMGSDFTNDDLVREVSLVEEYTVTMKTESDHYLLTLVPKENTPTVWGKIESRVAKDSLLPVEQTYYDERGRKVRLMRFQNVKDFDGRKLPSVMELVPLTKKGHSTKMIYDSLKFNVKINEDTFSLRNLQKRI